MALPPHLLRLDPFVDLVVEVIVREIDSSEKKAAAPAAASFAQEVNDEHLTSRAEPESTQR